MSKGTTNYPERDSSKKKAGLLSRLFSNSRFLLIFSVVFAFIIWVVVATTIRPEFESTIADVPVRISSQAQSVLSRLGLNVVDVSPSEVEVKVRGAGYVIGQLKPEEISVAPVFSSVTDSGTQSLHLEWNRQGDESFEVISMTPASVSVRVDRYETKTLTIQATVSGASYSVDYIKEDEIITPEQVTLTGPAGDLSKVSRAIVSVDVDKELSSTETFTSEIVLLDSNGNEVISDHIKMDFDAAEVTIPILKKREIPLVIGFTNQPPGFPIDDLEYTLSNDTVTVAGPQTLVDSYNEILLGYVNFKNLDIGHREVFDVELPSGFDNVDKVLSVSVKFETDDYVSQNFNIDEIKIVNPPANYDVNISEINQRLTKVRVIGPPEVMETLSADDLVAEVDLSDREVATGQMRWPVKIYAPGKGLVWAYGDYDTLVEISDKQ